MTEVIEHSGPTYLSAVTALLQRARREDPTTGLWEAADFQWWWRQPRGSDDQPKLFWYDDDGPVAAAVTTEWRSATWLDLIALPSVRAALLPEVFARARVLATDLSSYEMLVDDSDELLIGLLRDARFRKEPGDVTAWLDAADSPEPTTLAEGYTLHSRAESDATPHHFTRRSGGDVEQRLRQTSLYRPGLDLFVVDDSGDVAGYGLFWTDPTTGVGLVEPMRTEEQHQGKGIGRHVLTVGVRELFAAGSERVKVSYDPDNAPAAALYLGVGFVPTMTCSLWVAPSTQGANPR